MKRSAPPTRTPASLSESTNHQIKMYALAASAAGVGMLALSPTAEARIVYTPANVTIDGRHGTFLLDLNHDGVNDFLLAYFSHHFGGSIYVGGAQSGNNVRGFPSSMRSWFASRLRFGVRVGSRGQVPHGRLASVTASNGTIYRGPWCKAHGITKGYLGFRFVIKGKVHFGWARLKVSCPRPSALLTGYAYETIPNKPITAGKTKGPDVIRVQPASLGNLARGASAISSWRVKPTSATTP
jgi:hypothetical protein